MIQLDNPVVELRFQCCCLQRKGVAEDSTFVASLLCKEAISLEFRSLVLTWPQSRPLSSISSSLTASSSTWSCDLYLSPVRRLYIGNQPLHKQPPEKGMTYLSRLTSQKFRFPLQFSKVVSIPRTMATDTASPQPFTGPSSNVQEFKDVLKSSTRVLALCGAGLSAASGLDTFRGAGGMWRNHEATALATPVAFERDPGLVWLFYSYRRHKSLQAKPNAGHYALVELSKKMPDFITLTQNVDGE